MVDVRVPRLERDLRPSPGLAGRRYSFDAELRYRETGTYLLIDQVMRPAIAHAARVASVTAVAIAVGAALLIRAAAKRDAQIGRAHV